MGSSFVSLDGRGFWALDYMLEVWFHFLVKAIDEGPEGLEELREELAFLAAGGSGSGIVSIDLDDYLTNQAQRDQLVDCSDQALNLLSQFGEFLPVDYLSSIPDHFGRTWNGDWPTKYGMCIASHFIQLLRGELVTTVSTSRTICVNPEP